MVVRNVFFGVFGLKGLFPSLTGTVLLLFALAALAIPTAHAQDRPVLSEEAATLLGSELKSLPSSGNLLDAWAVVERHALPQWAYSFVQEKHPETFDIQRLAIDLEGLAIRARLSGNDRLARGLSQWSRTLATLTQSRIPGRLTPTRLMNHLRDVPTLDDLARLGWCQPPAWVEVWSAQGVTRHPWQPDITTQSLLQDLPEWAYEDSNHVHVVTPLGEVQRIGIAAWNHQSASLIPGSRVVTQVPLQSVTSQWLDSALPRFLTTRVSGVDCVSFPLSSSTANDIHVKRTAK